MIVSRPTPLPPTPAQVAIVELDTMLRRLELTASSRERFYTLDVLARRLRNEADKAARTAEWKLAA